MLGVPFTATPEDLRQAYRRLARRYHPDKNPQGHAMFAEIASAYGLLSDPERRLRYDLERRSAPSPQEAEDDRWTAPAPERTPPAPEHAAAGSAGSAGSASSANSAGSAASASSAGRTATAPPGRPYGERPSGRRARPEQGERPEDPLARLERLHGPRPTAGTVVKLLFYLPAGGFLAVLTSAFITVSLGDAARDTGRAAAIVIWLALWSFLVVVKVRLWLLYRRVSGAGGR
ncbi:hypothetical protein Plo01_24910 [Planobispora longispora]|uniref:J domain-containing protein n=1 Tax=Planobispora longispora TaxID=28887 RepID=A0A8J3RLL4_9ACTN|nr:hypothetical protein Plo01_24910 [Planobispora longispora]